MGLVNNTMLRLEKKHGNKIYIQTSLSNPCSVIEQVRTNDLMKYKMHTNMIVVSV